MIMNFVQSTSKYKNNDQLSKNESSRIGLEKCTRTVAIILYTYDELLLFIFLMSLSVLCFYCHQFLQVRFNTIIIPKADETQSIIYIDLGRVYISDQAL